MALSRVQASSERWPNRSTRKSSPASAERQSITMVLEFRPDMVFAAKQIDFLHGETGKASIQGEPSHKLLATPGEGWYHHPPGFFLLDETLFHQIHYSSI